jgi:hypothetical protein
MSRLRWMMALLVVGCGAQSQGGREPVREKPILVAVDAGSRPPELPDQPDENILYPLDQAVADALSGPLTHIGTGKWYGIARLHACAYRNQRVIVVNVYCTVKETRAFRVDVFSPRYGHVSIYAEGKVPISTIRRDEYFTFKAKTEPTPDEDSGLPQLGLSMSFAELQAYDKARYERFLPGCYGGVELQRPQGGCLDALAPRATEWAERNGTFLREPPAEWYRLVQELRARAPSEGR